MWAGVVTNPKAQAPPWEPKTGHRCPCHSGQLALPSWPAATFRRATWALEEGGLQLSLPSCNTAATSHCKLASQWPVVRVWMEAQGAQDPWALQLGSPAPRHPCGPSWHRGRVGHCDSGPARGSYPALSDSAPLSGRGSVAARDPNAAASPSCLRGAVHHHPCQVGNNLSPGWESPEGK